MNQQQIQTIEQHRQDCIQSAGVNLLPWWGHIIGWIAGGGIAVGLIFGKVIEFDWLSWHSALLCGMILAEVLIGFVNLSFILKWRRDSNWREQTKGALNRYMLASEFPLTHDSAKDVAGSITELISKRINLRFTWITVFSMVLCVFICGSFLYTVLQSGIEVTNLKMFLLPAISLACVSGIVMLINMGMIVMSDPVLTEFKSVFANERATEVEGTFRRDEEPAAWKRDQDQDVSRSASSSLENDGLESFETDRQLNEAEGFPDEFREESPEPEGERVDFGDEYVSKDDSGSSSSKKTTSESGMWD